MRTRFGFPCVSETDGHGSDWFTGRDYLLSESFMDANCLPSEPIYPSCPMLSITKRSKRLRAVSPEFERLIAARVIINEQIIEGNNG